MGDFLIIVGVLGLFIGLFLLLVALIIKKPKKKLGIFTVAAFALTIFGVAIAPPLEESSEEESKSTKVAEDTQTPEEKKVEEEAKAKEEAVKKENAEVEKKAKAEKKLAAEKEYYMNEVKSKVDTQMGMYDEAWSTLWVPTFEGISDGTVDVYKAYENMKTLEQNYKTLESSFPAIPDEGLSKANKKQLDEFKSKMRFASMWRAEAASKAQAMFNDGDFSPASLDEVKKDVGFSDNELMQAAIALTTLETKLGIELEE